MQWSLFLSLLIHWYFCSLVGLIKLLIPVRFLNQQLHCVCFAVLSRVLPCIAQYLRIIYHNYFILYLLFVFQQLWKEQTPYRAGIMPWSSWGCTVWVLLHPPSSPHAFLPALKLDWKYKEAFCVCFLYMRNSDFAVADNEQCSKLSFNGFAQCRAARIEITGRFMRADHAFSKQWNFCNSIVRLLHK